MSWVSKSSGLWLPMSSLAFFVFGVAFEKYSLDHYAPRPSISFEMPIPMPELRRTPLEAPWCDRRGWALEGSGCAALGDRAIPLPRARTCPGAYEIWRYDSGRPAICVRRA